jgi:SAM-dependent methyltransferase
MSTAGGVEADGMGVLPSAHQIFGASRLSRMVLAKAILPTALIVKLRAILRQQNFIESPKNIEGGETRIAARENFVETLVERFCIGNGLEIGPGKSPYGPRIRTKYLDKHRSNKDGTPNPDIIGDASSIPICSAQFDFLISSHCLEHVPNTLRTLKEWARVIRPGGTLFLVLPHGDRTFDRYRAKTTLEHHIHDLKSLGEAKSDPSHFEEMKKGWLMNPDPFDEQKKLYEKEWGAPIWDFEFRIRNDVLHYHVWTQSEMVDILRYLGFEILYVADYFKERPDSFIVVSRKPC